MIKCFKLTHKIYIRTHQTTAALIGECFMVIEGKSCFIALIFVEPSFMIVTFSPNTNRRKDVFNDNVPSNDDNSSEELDFINRQWGPSTLLWCLHKIRSPEGVIKAQPEIPSLGSVT